MAKYHIPYYGTTKYGGNPRLVYSVEPMTMTVVDFYEAKIYWETPRGDFSKIRLVRNQSTFPETAEDGIIIWEENATEGTVSRDYFFDGYDNPNDIPLVAGKPVYYRMFLFTSDKVWVDAGSISDVIPKSHDMQAKMMDILPKVFTSVEQSPFGVVDTESDLYKFMEGFSFTFEELMTYIDLLLFNHNFFDIPRRIVPIRRDNLGLTPEPNLPLKNQKRLIREALYMYGRKGTTAGLSTYCESLTGFAPTITVSDNLLLSIQDSTFYSGTGNWDPTNGTLTSSTDEVPVAGDYVVDITDTGKIVASSAGNMTLGADDPIRKGIPVTKDTDYVLSAQIKCPSTGDFTLTIEYFDGNGVTTGSSDTLTDTATNTWQRFDLTTTSSADAVYAVLTFAWLDTATYYIDQICFQSGSTVSYKEARAIDIFLDASKVNLIKNPSFEVDDSDWTSSGSVSFAQDTDISSEAYTGTYSGKLTGTGAWTFTSNTADVIAGQYYTVSHLIKSDASMNITIRTRDDSSVIIDEYTAAIPAEASWERYQTSLLVPSDSTAVTIEVEFSGDAGTFYLDCIQLERAFKASEYFDGNLPIEFGAVWGGTADDSFTYLYPNRLIKVYRLALTLSEWIMPNTFWTLRTWSGLEYNTLTAI